MTTLIYTERLYPDTTEEERIYPPGTMVIVREHTALSQLSDEDCAVAEGLLMFRHWVTAADLDRMPRLRAIVRMGVGYDRVDRAAAAARGVLVCNVPDYGTTEVADHAIALALALRRGLMLYVDRQRRANALPWDTVWTPLVQRSSTQVFGIVGLGRIGIAAALRAKALGSGWWRSTRTCRTGRSWRWGSSGRRHWSRCCGKRTCCRCMRRRRRTRGG